MTRPYSNALAGETREIEELRPRRAVPMRSIATVIVAALYAFWLFAFFYAGNSIWSFVKLGRYAARAGFGVARGTGFDGQFYYCLARIPTHAVPCLDAPGYRYSRILYPLAARALAIGQASLIPYTLLAVNVAAVVITVYLIAVWLEDHGLSPFFALIYGFAPPVLTAVQRDLSEPLSYALVAGAILAFDRRRPDVSALLFALATLTREAVIIFPLACACAFLTGRAPRWQRVGHALLFAATALMPYALWKVYLARWLGNSGLPSGALPTRIPFGGLVAHGWHANETVAAVTIVLPALICAAVAVASLRILREPAAIALLLNVLLDVVFLNAESYHDYFGAGRAALGVVLAAIYCLPLFDVVTRGRRWWLVASSFGWLLLAPFWFVVVPVWLLAGSSA